MAQALVVALATVGCGGGASSGALDREDGTDSGQPVPVSPSRPIAGDGGSADGGSDAAACPAPSGYFACGDNVCSRAIQACEDGGCEWYGGIAPACGACPTCACLNAETTFEIATCQDDGAGGITFTRRMPGRDGAACKQDTDCQFGLCQNGACECKPAGASHVAQNECCSGWYNAGTCAAQAGSPCITRVSDCYGGTCTDGACACVGPGGYCYEDSTCCAGATRCVAEQCQ
jgi:hypothetical protein